MKENDLRHTTNAHFAEDSVACRAVLCSGDSFLTCVKTSRLCVSGHGTGSRFKEICDANKCEAMRVLLYHPFLLLGDSASYISFIEQL